MKTTEQGISETLMIALNSANYVFSNEFAFNGFYVINKTAFVIDCLSQDEEEEDINKEFGEMIPAYTMIELWEMLPKDIYQGENRQIRSMLGNSALYQDGLKMAAMFHDDNPCNALARLVIWCIENNHKLNLKNK